MKNIFPKKWPTVKKLYHSSIKILKYYFWDYIVLKHLKAYWKKKKKQAH